MKLISKRNFVFTMVIFLLFITVASVSATDVMADEGDLAVDTLSSTDDTIIYSTNPEDELSATIDDGESVDVLGTTYEHANASLIPVYESDKNYSWHVYDITPKNLTSYYPRGNDTWKEALKDGKWAERGTAEWDPKTNH